MIRFDPEAPAQASRVPRFLKEVDVRVLSVAVLVGAVAVAGCAKKSYVQKEVGEVNKKVDTVSAEVEKTQQRVQKTEVRIDEVDKGAKTGITEAKDSAGKAMTRPKKRKRRPRASSSTPSPCRTTRSRSPSTAP